MDEKDYTSAFWVDQPPEKVLAVIGDVAAYWAPPGNLAGATIEGSAAKEGDEFTYRDRGIGHCRFRVSEIELGRQTRQLRTADVSRSRLAALIAGHLHSPDR